MKTAWERLPAWILDAALPVPVRSLERTKSMAGVRCLMALYSMAGSVPQSEVGPLIVTASLEDIAGWAGLTRSSVQKGLGELLEEGVLSRSERGGYKVPLSYWLARPVK